MNKELVLSTLLAAVPIMASKIHCLEDVLFEISQKQHFEMILSKADEFMFDGGKKEMAELIVAVAVLSKLPGGVKFMGEKFDYSEEQDA